MKEVACAGIVPFFNGLVVLVRELTLNNAKGNDWLLPKGHVEALESHAEAAVREAREEAGVVIDPKSVVQVAETDLQEIGLGELKHIKWFKGQVTEFATDLATDGRTVGMFRPLDALAELTYLDHRKVLVQAL